MKRHSVICASTQLLNPTGEKYQAKRNTLEGLALRGVLDVSEQASQASKGKIWVSGTRGLTKSIRIVEGAGTYQGQSNYAQDVNPLYDFVAEQFDEYPEHRIKSPARNGWTHHGLRHWAVSSRIKAGVPLPLIAKEMGHSEASFTLERYGPRVGGSP